MCIDIQQACAIKNLIAGTDTQDGTGVRLTRLMPSNRLSMLDPFLLEELDQAYRDYRNGWFGTMEEDDHAVA